MLTNGIQQTEDFNDFKSNHFTAVIKPVGSVTWTTNYYFGQEQPDGGEPTGPDGFFRVFDSYVAYADARAQLRPRRQLRDQRGQQGRRRPGAAGHGVYARYQLSSRRRSPALRAARRRGAVRRHRPGAPRDHRHGRYKFADGFLVRAEFRRDWSNEAFFTGPRPGEPRDHQNTALLGMVWWFGNKTGAW